MCEYTCEEHARGLALCHTLCPSSCPTLTPWKRSSSLRALSQPAPSSWWLLALSSFSSSVPDQLPALPTYSQPQQKKITHLVTACTVQINSHLPLAATTPSSKHHHFSLTGCYTSAQGIFNNTSPSLSSYISI